MRFLVAVGLVLASLPLSGCVDNPFDRVTFSRDTLILRFTLHSLDNSTDQYADPGPHCGTAQLDGGRLRLERDALKKAGDAEPILIVDGETSGNWMSTGSDAYVVGLPIDVLPGVQGETRPIARIEPGPDRTSPFVLVDGQLVHIPYEGITRDSDGKWSVSYRIEDGPDQHNRFSAGPCA